MNYAENAMKLLDILKSTLEECGHPYLSKLTERVETIKSFIEKNEIDSALLKANELLSFFAKNNIVSMATKINDVIEYLVRIDTKTKTA